MEVTKIKRHKYNKPKVKYQPTIGEELEVVEGDKVALTDPSENKRRRTLILNRKNGSWGFTLQSYGIHNKEENQLEMLTYVDYVDFNGAAHLAGMRAGDVILSINGTSVEDYDHPNLVNFIKSCGETMRMVVLFEDCCRKVALHLKYLKLKRVLAEKLFELRSLELQENRVLSGQTQFGSRRSSYASTSSADSHFDRLSLQPELDICYASAWSSPSEGDETSSPQGSVATPPFINRFEFDRCSLPVGYTGSVSSLGSNQSSPTGFMRDKRPMSMRLQYTHRSVANMLDVQLPVPQRLNPELLRSSASLSSFESLRSIDHIDGASLYKQTLLGNTRKLRKTESMAAGVRYRDKSPEFQKALNTSTRSLKYTVSGPPTTLLEMKPLGQRNGNCRHQSGPCQSDEALDKANQPERLVCRRSSSTSSLVSAARRHTRGCSPGISFPSPKPQLSPISYLIMDGDLYEIPCSSVDEDFPEFTDLRTIDDTVFTHKDNIEEENEAEPVDVKIYFDHPEESSTDNLSDAELHDVSLDSVDIYGFDTDSEGETIQGKDNKDSTISENQVSLEEEEAKDEGTSAEDEKISEKLDSKAVAEHNGDSNPLGLVGKDSKEKENSSSKVQAVVKCTNVDSGNEQNVVISLPTITTDHPDLSQVTQKLEEVVPYDAGVVSAETGALNGVRKKTKITPSNTTGSKTKHKRQKSPRSQKCKNDRNSVGASSTSVLDKHLSTGYICAKHKGDVQGDSNFSSDDVVSEIDIMLEHEDTYKFCKLCAKDFTSKCNTAEPGVYDLGTVDNTTIASSKIAMQVEKTQKSTFANGQKELENILGEIEKENVHKNATKPFVNRSESNIVDTPSTDNSILENFKHKSKFYPVPYRDTVSGFSLKESVPEMVQVKLEYINEQDEVTWL